MGLCRPSVQGRPGSGMLHPREGGCAGGVSTGPFLYSDTSLLLLLGFVDPVSQTGVYVFTQFLVSFALQELSI